MNGVSLRDQCRGRWQGLLPVLGIDARHLSGKHGPCPICGGKDRFRFDDKDGVGSWICSQCGSGDGFSLAMRINHWDFKEVAERVQTIVPTVQHVQPARERSERSLRDAMNRLWQAGYALKAGDLAARYLEARGLRLEVFPNSLRLVEKCRYKEGENDAPRYFPAMVAKITAPGGRPVTLHRTYLDEPSQKAAVESPRRLMPGKIEKGCAIQLAPRGPVMGVAEGIETALSASAIWRVPCWAAVSAGMLMAWEPPPDTREVIVFADNDRSYAGQSAAFALAHRLAARGMAVKVEMPADEGMDWNDVLRAEVRAA